jgi:hypothetical protein
MVQKRYTYPVKIATLKILEQNDYIFLKTEKLTGIKRQTIKVWAEKHGPDVFAGNSPLELALELVEKELRQNNLTTIHLCSEAMLVAITRLHELVKTEKNVLKLCRAMKMLSDINNNIDESGARSLKHPYR